MAIRKLRQHGILGKRPGEPSPEPQYIDTLPQEELEKALRDYGGIDPNTGQVSPYYKDLTEEQNRRIALQSGAGLDEGASVQGFGQAAPIPAGINPEDRAALESLFSGRMKEATDELGRQFAPQRAKLVAEEAALGRSRSPVGGIRTGKLDEAQGRALASMIGQLSGQRSQAELGLGSELRGLSARLGEGEAERNLRNLLSQRESRQRGIEFGQSQAFEKEKFGRGLLENAQGRSLSRELGQAQAEAAKPRQKSFLEEALPFLQIASDIGSKFIPTKSKVSYI